MRDLREAVRILGPKEVVDHNDRGNRYRERGEYDRALREFDRALEIAPFVSQIYSNGHMTGETPTRERDTSSAP